MYYPIKRLSQLLKFCYKNEYVASVYSFGFSLIREVTVLMCLWFVGYTEDTPFNSQLERWQSG